MDGEKIEAEKEFEQTCEPQIREALEHGRAVVCRIGAVGVIVVEQSQYELGSILIYDLGDGRSFLMWSHDFYYSDNRNFTAELPQTFEIVPDGSTGTVAGPCQLRRPTGGRTENLGRRGARRDRLDHRNLPRSESVVSGCPRDVLARWGYQKDE